MIQWLTKGKYKPAEKYHDVRTKTYVNRGHEGCLISFYNGTAQKFKADYIQVGIEGSRLYFRGAKDGVLGYKLSGDVGGSCRINTSNKEIIDFAKNHKALYRLTLAPVEGIY